MNQEKLAQALQNTESAFFSDLRKILQIPSVKAAPAPNAPFGKEAKRVLVEVLKIAKGYGFRTGQIGDVMGYAQLGEDLPNGEYVAAIGHLDVVEAGGNWQFPAFDLSEKDGFLYGRGVLDNKGPILSCLHALKVLKEMNLSLKRPIRIVFGTDEESGSSDVAPYLAREAPPVFAFTPDCKFPVVYGERGVVNVEVTTSFADIKRIGEIMGEMQSSFIPDELSIKIDGKNYTARGKRSPSNAPELAINALTLLAKELCETLTDSPLKGYFHWIAESFHEKYHGENWRWAFSDDDSGDLIMSPYKIEKTEDALVLSLAIRYPVSFGEEEILASLAQNMPPKSKIKVIRSLKSVLFDKEKPEIQALSKIYEEVTGLEGTPQTTTGATYARFFPNTVAFGPSFPGQKGIAHNADEWMKKEELLLCMKIYTLALAKLATQERFENG